MDSQIRRIEEKLRDLAPERDSKLKEIQREQERAEGVVINLAEKKRQREAELLAEKHEIERQIDQAREEERKKNAA